MEKKTVIIYEKEHSDVLADAITVTEQILKEKNHTVLRMPISQEKRGYEYFEELKKYDADYLISFAMAGFGWKTLSSQVSYNLLYAKQVHILIGDYAGYEEFLQKEYAINLFFFADNNKWTRDWENRYPGIPYMEKIPPVYIGKNLSVMERQADRKIIRRIVDRVTEIVEGSN